MGKHKSSKEPCKVLKLGKHSWAVAVRFPGAQKEVVDGFGNKAAAKTYAAKAPDLIALHLGQGR